MACLAAYIRDIPNVEVKVIDAKFDQLRFNDVEQAVLEFNPTLVGLTAFTNEIKPAAYLAAKIKKQNASIKTIIGGVHVTAIPKQTLKEFPYFDMAVVGEGETPLKEVIEYYLGVSNKSLSEIRGLAIRNPSGSILLNGHATRILDLDTLPMPAWDMFKPAKTYFVQSLRGCPFNCQFCMNPNGQVARKRSVDNTIKELNYIIDNYKPERISFGDELFSVDMNRTKSLLDQMIKENIGKKVKWDVQTHVKFVDQEMFYKFKTANVERVEIGIETGDETIMKKMGKGISMHKIREAYQMAKKAKVSLGTFFIIGQPNETKETIKKTIKLAQTVNPELPMFGLMTPYPGTEVSKLAAKNEGGYKLISTDWDNYNKQLGGAMEFAGLSRKQIEWIQIKAYLSVFLANRRFKDLVNFIWEYRKGAFEVIKKLFWGKKNIQNQKPADYDIVLNSGFQINKEDMLAARKKWEHQQKAEIKRTRKEMPQLFKI